MMRPPNPSAFPVVAENGLGHISSGMTLRDYFAGCAVQGMLARLNVFEISEEQIIALAFDIADKMLAAREVEYA